MNKNPSRLSHRALVLITALIGMGLALYLGLFQLRIIGSVWDPLFGEGSVRVLRSPLSRALPVPDSLVGAFGYFVEAMVVLIGGGRRYETLPRFVVFYAMIAMGMGAGSLALVGYQALGVQSWCSLCLVSALLSFVLVVPGLQEGYFAFRVLKGRKKGRIGPSKRASPPFTNGEPLNQILRPQLCK